MNQTQPKGPKDAQKPMTLKFTPELKLFFEPRTAWLMLAFFVGQLSWCSAVQAIIFDRRPLPPLTLSWYLYPLAGNIPGVQKFAGVGGTLSGISNSQMDVSVISLKGPSDNFDKGNFKINIFTLLDVPLIEDLLSFSYFNVDIRNGSWPEGQRGINSDPNKTYLLLASQVTASGGEVSAHFSKYQFEVYYGFTKGSVTPYGIVTPNGTKYNAQNAGIITQPQGAKWGAYLDDTDSRRDPRLGYRIKWDQWDIPASRTANASYRQTDKNLTFFIPLDQQRTWVMVLNQFSGDSVVTTPGVVNKKRYTCPPTSPPGCQTVLDQLYARQRVNATQGKATSLGGTARLRGYRTNRFYDSYSAFRAMELRWYVYETANPFNYLLEKGLLSGIQAAIFYEEGTVAPRRSALWTQKKSSYGIGARFILGNVIFRADVGVSTESTQTTVFIGYPF